MVLVDSHGISRVPRYSGACPTSQQFFAYRAFTVSGGPFQAASPWRRAPQVVVPQPRGSKLPRFGLFPVRSPLLGESRLISVPPGTEMFQFPGLAPLARWPASPPVGFPHSGILGSRLMCSSPRLIAAYHALHRLSMPRHPPCALLRLISNSFETSPEGPVSSCAVLTRIMDLATRC